MLNKAKILIVEDNRDICDILEHNLENEGYSISCAYDGIDGLKKSQQDDFQLIILDLMLPKMDGLEVCRQLRANAKYKNLPILMLTAKNSESDIVLGLGLGADDYMIKPFSPKEMVARVKALLRRAQTQKPNTLEVADKLIEHAGIVIDTARHEVKLNGQLIQLTLAEFKLLRTLIANHGRVFTRDQLLEKVAGENVVVIDRNIDVHIASLRKKLKSFSHKLVTIRGIGYRFDD